jgi:hypothetical protein
MNRFLFSSIDEALGRLFSFEHLVPRYPPRLLRVFSSIANRSPGPADQGSSTFSFYAASHTSHFERTSSRELKPETTIRSSELIQARSKPHQEEPASVTHSSAVKLLTMGLLEGCAFGGYTLYCLTGNIPALFPFTIKTREGA